MPAMPAMPPLRICALLPAAAKAPELHARCSELLGVAEPERCFHNKPMPGLAQSIGLALAQPVVVAHWQSGSGGQDSTRPHSRREQPRVSRSLTAMEGKTMGDLEWDYEDMPYEVSWSFNAFMDEYNRLYTFLNTIQGRTFDANHLEVPVQDTAELARQLDRERPKYDELINCGKQMSDKFPFLADDLLCRVELLAVKWEILQIFVLTQRPSAAENPHGLDSQFNEKHFHEWLSSVEDKMIPLKFKINWSAKAIKQKKNEMKIIQEDIVSQGQIVRSLIKSSKHKEESKIRQLEERWHKVWLRCLEWQCLLEGLGSSNVKDENIANDKCDGETSQCSDTTSTAMITEPHKIEPQEQITTTTSSSNTTNMANCGNSVIKTSDCPSTNASLVEESPSCDASAENSSASSEEDGEDEMDLTLRRPDSVTKGTEGEEGNKEVEIIEFWDQESYLSEHHYDEAPIDDSSLNMLNFGDDYRNYIDSLSEDEEAMEEVEKMSRQGLLSPVQSVKDEDQTSVKSHGDESVCSDTLKKSTFHYRRNNEKVLTLLRNLEKCKVFNEELNAAKTFCSQSVLELTAIRKHLASSKESSLLSALICRWENLCSIIEDGIQVGKKVLTTCQTINILKLSLHQMLNDNPRADQEDHLTMLDVDYVPDLMRIQSEIFSLNVNMHEIMHELQSLISSLERKPRTRNQPRRSTTRLEFHKMHEKMLELYSLWEQVYQRFSQFHEERQLTPGLHMPPSHVEFRLLDTKVDDSGISETSSCGRKRIPSSTSRPAPNHALHDQFQDPTSVPAPGSPYPPVSSICSRTTTATPSPSPHSSPTAPQSVSRDVVTTTPLGRASTAPIRGSRFGRTIVRSILQVQLMLGLCLAWGLYLEPQCCEHMCPPFISSVFLTTSSGVTPPI